MYNSLHMYMYIEFTALVLCRASHKHEYDYKGAALYYTGVGHSPSNYTHRVCLTTSGCAFTYMCMYTCTCVHVLHVHVCTCNSHSLIRGDSTGSKGHNLLITCAHIFVWEYVLISLLYPSYLATKVSRSCI
jgi:hypothetical protein